MERERKWRSFSGLPKPDGCRLYTLGVKVPDHLQEIAASLLKEEARAGESRGGKANSAPHRLIETELRGPARTREIWRSTHTADFSEAKRGYPAAFRFPVSVSALCPRCQACPIRCESEPRTLGRSSPSPATGNHSVNHVAACN